MGEGADTPLPLRLRVRTRPGMYIGGGLSERGIRYIVDDLVGDLIATPGVDIPQVRCTIEENQQCRIEIRGEFGPIEPSEFEVLDSCDSWSEATAPKCFSLAVAAAFSEQFHIEVIRGGRRWTQSFAAGIPVGPPQTDSTTAASRLSIRYRLDRTLFKSTDQLRFLPLCGRIQERAMFHPATRFTIEDETPPRQVRDYQYPMGLLSYASEVEHRSLGYSRFWYCRFQDGEERAEAVLIPRYDSSAIVESFVNEYRAEGGTHIDGLKAALGEVAKQFRRDIHRPFGKRGNSLGGLRVLLIVRVKAVEYHSATKDIVAGNRPFELVYNLITTQLPQEIARTMAEEARR